MACPRRGLLGFGGGLWPQGLGGVSGSAWALPYVSWEWASGRVSHHKGRWS